MVDLNDQTFVIDCGPDFRYQMLRENVKKIDAILITHGHRDHIAGIDDVRAYNYAMQKAIDVYARENVLENVKEKFHYAFEANKYPGVPEINLHIIKNEPFIINEITITPIEVLHYKTKIFGYRIGDFTYITDANFISENEKEKIKGSKVIVLNALRKKFHITHFTLNDAVNILTELKPEKAFITHISHEMGLYNEVTKELPPNIMLASDGLSLEF